MSRSLPLGLALAAALFLTACGSSNPKLIPEDRAQALKDTVDQVAQRVGDDVAGINGLAVSMPVAGIVASIVVGPSVIGRMTPEILLIGIGLAILLPVVPFALEMQALRRLTTAAFGTLMALEPAFALIVGMIVLTQMPGVSAVVGICFVVAAGVGAARAGSRSTPVTAEVG